MLITRTVLDEEGKLVKRRVVEDRAETFYAMPHKARHRKFADLNSAIEWAKGWARAYHRRVVVIVTGITRGERYAERHVVNP